ADVDWVGQGDGLLALDRNHDGAIDDGGELFGTSTATAGGGKARDGFAALAGLDANGDGVVDRKDAQFGDLRVWVDANADGVSQGAELRTLDALGIASLKVGASATSELDNGNWIGLRSSYTTTDGGVGQVADVWFRAERATPAGTASSQGGEVGTQVGTQVSTQVSALAQALGGYAQAQAEQAGLPATPSLIAAGASGERAPASGLSGNIASLAEQMKRYDASTGLSGSVTAHATEWFRKPNDNGILAAK
ncbi:MAG: heme utilization protein, partial [Duganella sp.]